MSDPVGDEGRVGAIISLVVFVILMALFLAGAFWLAFHLSPGELQ